MAIIQNDIRRITELLKTQKEEVDKFDPQKTKIKLKEIHERLGDVVEATFRRRRDLIRIEKLYEK